MTDNTNNTNIPLIYIAAPFTAATTWGRAENVRLAERWGLVVAKAGGWPVMPTVNTQLFFGEVPEKLALDGTMQMMFRCDAVLVASRFGYAGKESSGVAAEITAAMARNIVVWHSEDFGDDVERPWTALHDLGRAINALKRR